MSLWCQHKINTPLTYEGQHKSAHWPINSRKPNSSRIHQLINLLTAQLTNSPTHTLINLSTKNLLTPQLTNSQTHNLINLSTQNFTNLQTSSTHKLTYSQTYKLKTSPTYKPYQLTDSPNSKTYKLKTSPIQKLKSISFILQRHSNFHSVLGEILVKK